MSSLELARWGVFLLDGEVKRIPDCFQLAHALIRFNHWGGEPDQGSGNSIKRCTLDVDPKTEANILEKDVVVVSVQGVEPRTLRI